MNQQGQEPSVVEDSRQLTGIVVDRDQVYDLIKKLRKAKYACFIRCDKQGNFIDAAPDNSDAVEYVVIRNLESVAS